MSREGQPKFCDECDLEGCRQMDTGKFPPCVAAAVRPWRDVVKDPTAAAGIARCRACKWHTRVHHGALVPLGCRICSQDTFEDARRAMRRESVAVNSAVRGLWHEQNCYEAEAARIAKRKKR